MRIILITALNAGDAEYKNMGDVAMLQVAVKRIANLWPDARIEVLTDSAENLARYCPKAVPLPRAGCACWLTEHFFLGRRHRYLPSRFSIGLSTLKVFLGVRWPGLLDSLTMMRLAIRDPQGHRESFNRVRAAIEDCDAVIVCGAGGFADSCRDWNLFALWAIQAATRRRTMVAMLGQGVGPLNDPFVISWARRVLPKVKLIGLRGGKGSQSILESIGVRSSVILTTGDEAVEIANAATVNNPGYAIGVNLRIASYSGVGADLIGEVAVALREFATDNTANLVPIPIAFHEYANDCFAIRQLLAECDVGSDGGAGLDSPEKLFDQIARCRIVVTGAYHAAVFALAQGIPAVCLYGSSYYSAKFEGLKDLFGVGCTTVILNAPDWRKRFHDAVERAWNSADEVRPSLLSSAADQIRRSQMAYQYVRELIDSESYATAKEALLT